MRLLNVPNQAPIQTPGLTFCWAAAYIGTMRVALRRALGCLVLLVFSSSLGLPLLATGHLLAGLDPDCASPLIATGRQTEIDDPADGPTGSSAHCVLCHWLRAVGSARPALASAAGPQFVTAGPSASGAAVAPREAVIGEAPSRAPPQSVHF